MKRKMRNREWLKSLAMAFTAIIFCVILTAVEAHLWGGQKEDAL